MKIKVIKNKVVSARKDRRIDKGVELGFSEGNFSAKTKIGKNCIFRMNTIVYQGVIIGDNLQTGPNVLIRENNIIGNNVVVWHGSTLNPGNIIGDESRIHSNCFLEQVNIGKRVFVGPNVVFTNDPHPRIPLVRECFKGAFVEDDAIIGGNVTILPHVKIGKAAVVGAGSVVTKNVPAGEVWVGNPAKFLKKAKDVTCKREGKLHYPYKDKHV